MPLRPDHPAKGEDSDLVRAPVWRRILAAPLTAAAVVTWVIGKHILHRISEVFAWLALGFGAHVYYVFVQAERWALGQPTWQLRDLASGLQPRSKGQLAYARSLPDIAEVKCDCGEPDCALAKRLKSNPHFLPRLQHALISGPAQQRMSNLVRAEINRIEQDLAAKQPESPPAEKN